MEGDSFVSFLTTLFFSGAAVAGGPLAPQPPWSDIPSFPSSRRQPVSSGDTGTSTRRLSLPRWRRRGAWTSSLLRAGGRVCAARGIGSPAAGKGGTRLGASQQYPGRHARHLYHSAIPRAHHSALFEVAGPAVVLRGFGVRCVLTCNVFCVDRTQPLGFLEWKATPGFSASLSS